MRRFTPAELLAIDRALSVAAGVYDDDAKLMQINSLPELARTFQDQARVAREISEAIAREEVS